MSEWSEVGGVGGVSEWSGVRWSEVGGVRWVEWVE